MACLWPPCTACRSTSPLLTQILRNSHFISLVRLISIPWWFPRTWWGRLDGWMPVRFRTGLVSHGVQSLCATSIGDETVVMLLSMDAECHWNTNFICQAFLMSAQDCVPHEWQVSMYSCNSIFVGFPAVKPLQYHNDIFRLGCAGAMGAFSVFSWYTWASADLHFTSLQLLWRRQQPASLILTADIRIPWKILNFKC